MGPRAYFDAAPRHPDVEPAVDAIEICRRCVDDGGVVRRRLVRDLDERGVAGRGEREPLGGGDAGDVLQSLERIVRAGEAGAGDRFGRRISAHHDLIGLDDPEMRPRRRGGRAHPLEDARRELAHARRERGGRVTPRPELAGGDEDHRGRSAPAGETVEHAFQAFEDGAGPARAFRSRSRSPARDR